MTHSISLRHLNISNVTKVLMGFVTLVVLAYFSSIVADSQVISILQDSGVNVPKGLASGLAAATTVAEVNSLLAAAAITVPGPVQWAIAGAGAVSL